MNKQSKEFHERVSLDLIGGPALLVKDGSVSFGLGFAAFLVSLQSFLFGYIFSCLNSCLLLGDSNNRKLRKFKINLVSRARTLTLTLTLFLT